MLSLTSSWRELVTCTAQKMNPGLSAWMRTGDFFWDVNIRLRLSFSSHSSDALLWTSAQLSSASDAPAPEGTQGHTQISHQQIIRGLASLVAQTVKNLPTMLETCVWSLGWEYLLEKQTATYSSILPWRIPRDTGAWWATGGRREVDTTEQLSTAQMD